MGDLSWLNDYIGLPYVFGGRNRNGLDCYGLPKLVYQEQYNIDLPDWVFDKVNLKEINGEIVGQVGSGRFTEVSEPDDGDFAVCYRTRLAHHLGLFYGGGVIHCSEGLGVIYQPKARFEKEYANVIYGKWEP